MKNRYNTMKTIDPVSHKRRKTILLVILWICFLPIMATIALVKTDALQKKAKIPLIALVWIAFLAVGAFGGNNKTTTSIDRKSELTSDDKGSRMVGDDSKNEQQTEAIETTVTVESLSLVSEADHTMEIGEVKSIIIDVKPAGLSPDAIIAEAADPSVVEISDIVLKNNVFNDEFELKVTAKSVGSTSITVRSVDKTVACEPVNFTVEKPPLISEMDLGASYFHGEVGDTQQYTASFLPAGLKREDVVLEIGDESIVQVTIDAFESKDENTTLTYTITALAPGETTLVFKAADQKTEDSVSVSVEEKDTSRVVWITPYGEKYHFSQACAGDQAIETTLNKAIKQSIEPCAKCAE